MAQQRQGRRRNKSMTGPNHGKRPTRKMKKPMGLTSRDRRQKRK